MKFWMPGRLIYRFLKSDGPLPSLVITGWIGGTLLFCLSAFIQIIIVDIIHRRDSSWRGSNLWGIYAGYNNGHLLVDAPWESLKICTTFYLIGALGAIWLRYSKFQREYHEQID